MRLSGFADSFAEWSYMTTKSAVAWKGHRYLARGGTGNARRLATHTEFSTRLFLHSTCTGL